jgi:hypothetical protein
MVPNQVEIEIPLLKSLEELGGKARPSEIYSLARKFFPNLTDADLAETLQSGGNKRTNRVQWVRQRLISLGEMTSPAHGVWAITYKGRQRLAAKGISPAPAGRSHPSASPLVQPDVGPAHIDALPSTNLEELADEYFRHSRRRYFRNCRI